MLQVQNLTVRYGNVTIVDDVSFSVQEGQWLMVVGPNGAGKSTLVNAISRGVDYTGNVQCAGRDIKTYASTELAKQIGVLMQHHAVNYAFTVDEIVRLGRYVYSQGLFGGTRDEDEQKIQQALAMTGMEALREQSVLTLSGGELQRTFLAQLLAQNPRLMILDEPSNHLDLVYQKQVFRLVQQWMQEPGRAVISVVHDLSLAKAFGTHALLLHQGKIAASGPVDEVICPAHLNSVYGMDVSEWMRSMLSLW